MSEMAAPLGETGGHNLESPVAGQIEDSTSCEGLEDTDLIRSYIGHGFALVPIPKGQKGPNTPGWNRPESCITTPGELHKLHNKNIGLAHAYSRTCALDIDDFSEAEQWFASHSIDLVQHCMSAVQVSSGRQNHAKLIFKLPLGLESLPSVKIRSNKSDAVDFRCGTANGTTVQDLLPPSIHPDTGESYKWVNGDHTNMSVLPDEILEIWKRLLEEKQSTTTDTTDIKAPAEWKHVSLEALNLPAHTQHLIKHGDTQANAYHGDRSEAVYGATKDLICAGATDHQILSILTDSEYEISEKPLERGKGDFQAACRWLMPQLAKARAGVKAEATSVDMSLVSAPDLTFTLLDPYENPADIPEREYVLDGAFKVLKATVGVIAATAGCAKSTMACTIAVSAATGIPLLGVTVKKPVNVGVIEGEDDVIHMRGQFAAICQHHNIPSDKLQNCLFYISGAEKKPVFGVKDPITKQITTTGFALYVHGFIAQNNLKILFAGPLSTLVRGWDDKSNADMQEVLDLFGVIAAQTRCTIILTHHVTKSGMKGGYDPEYYAGNPEAIRGGSALVGAVRAAFTLCRMNDSSAKDYGITDVTEQNRHIRLDNAKVNYSLLSGTPTWVRLASVSLPNGDEYGVLEQAEFTTMEIDPSLLSQADKQKHGQYRNAVANILEVLRKDRLSRSEMLPELCTRLDVGETTARTRLGQAIPTRGESDEDFTPATGRAFTGSQYRMWMEQGPTATSPVIVCGERAADPIQPTSQDRQVTSAVELIRKHPNGIYQAELLQALKDVLQIPLKQGKVILEELRLIPLIEVVVSGRHTLFRYQSEITLCSSANSATHNPLHSCEAP